MILHVNVLTTNNIHCQHADEIKCNHEEPDKQLGTLHISYIKQLGTLHISYIKQLGTLHISYIKQLGT